MSNVFDNVFEIRVENVIFAAVPRLERGFGGVA
jgi:hypothetical protein